MHISWNLMMKDHVDLLHVRLEISLLRKNSGKN